MSDNIDDNPHGFKGANYWHVSVLLECLDDDDREYWEMRVNEPGKDPNTCHARSYWRKKLIAWFAAAPIQCPYCRRFFKPLNKQQTLCSHSCAVNLSRYRRRNAHKADKGMKFLQQPRRQFHRDRMVRRAIELLEAYEDLAAFTGVEWDFEQSAAEIHAALDIKETVEQFIEDIATSDDPRPLRMGMFTLVF